MADPFFPPDDSDWDALGDRLTLFDPIKNTYREIVADYGEQGVQLEDLSFARLRTLRVSRALGVAEGMQIEWDGQWLRLGKRDAHDEFDDIYELTTCSQPANADWRPGCAGPRR